VERVTVIRTRASEIRDRAFNPNKDFDCALYRCVTPWRVWCHWGEAHALDELRDWYRLASQQTSNDWRDVAIMLAQAISETWGESFVPSSFMCGPATPEDVVVLV
jgi:hypothetical protein